jgi:hypothetical protein
MIERIEDHVNAMSLSKTPPRASSCIVTSPRKKEEKKCAKIKFTWW